MPTAYSSPFDETLDAATPPGPRALGEGRCVYLVEGSSVCMTSETRDLLRARLRVASIVMGLGFAAFLVWHFMMQPFRSPSGAWLFAAHSLVTLVLAICGLTLCRQCPNSLRMLRVKEFMVFGLPALFFLFYQYVYSVWCAVDYGVLPSVAGMWLMLIFTYALFIPNHWRRAAAVVMPIAIAPVALTWYLMQAHPHCAAAQNATVQFLAQAGLLMTLGGITATLGVGTIGRLRRQAFEARQLGQYRLRQRLGAGGMGEVYLAEHQLMKRPCAIKIIRPDKAGDPRVLARFEREVQATARLSHWNSIEIFDYGRTEDGTFYYVMEFLPGLTLSQLVEQHGPLPAARVLYLLRQICEALREAHDMGLIHRDIKPANIFAAQRGGQYDVAKLLDFGMVKPIAEMDSAHITQEGSITGSPLFMAPEQATGDEPDGRSDIYSLGAVAYYALTGQPPFRGDNPVKVLLAHVHDKPLPPSELVAQLSHEFEDVILRCLEKRPSDRFANVAELAAALEQCSESRGWTREDAAAWWRELGTLPPVPLTTDAASAVVHAGS